MTSSTSTPSVAAKSGSPIKVTHLLHTMAYGGIETVIINWLSNVSKQQIDVQVVVFANPGATEDHFIEHAKAAGLCVKKIPWARSKPVFKAAKELDVLLSEHGTEVLHMHNAYAEVVGYISGRRNNLKMVSTIYVWAGKDFGFKRYVLQKLSAALIKRFDLLTVQCEKARQESGYWGFDQSKVKVLPSGYTLPEPSGLTATQRITLREERGANEDTIVVCNVARLYPEKGQSRMLKIWKRIVAECPNAQLWIYGIGPLEEELKALCESLELQDSVFFLGFASNLLLELELCDVQLHPSYNEGIPIAICAGMAAGLPMVATEVGGIPEVIQNNKSGLLVHKDDEAGIQAHTVDLINDSQLRDRIGAEAKRFIMEEYSMEAAVRILSTTYQNLLD